MTELIKNLMSLPPLTSKHGANVDILILYIHYLMAALFVIWIVYFGYALFRFSAKRNPRASYSGYQGHTTTWMEIGVAVIEGVILVALAIPLWANAADGFPEEFDKDGALVLGKDGKPAVTAIRVTAQQFAWNSRYPGADRKFGQPSLNLLSADTPLGMDKKDPIAKDDVIPPLNEMMVPVNKPVILHISSLDVIHAFACHPFRIAQDAIPGMSIATHFVPTKVGDYQITCGQLCGNSHYFMKGFFKVRPEAEYEEWLAKQPKYGGAGTSFE